ncbi:hypothetical protein UPYG_G00150350 [Umbra pygmaea]|uniref:Uncharacterized protein n=1 Tax=Umbra pygmaea TaxID=75934 RepID=A0ABD0WWT3_UMBPY
MKRKGDISSFFSAKTKRTSAQKDASGEQVIEIEAEQQRSDKLESKDDQAHDEVEGDEKEQQESVSDKVEGKDDQGNNEVEGEHDSDEKVQEGESERQQDNVQSSDREMRVPDPLQVISSRTGPHDISKSRCEGPTQPKRESFPRTLQGGASRSFRTDWLALGGIYC